MEGTIKKLIDKGFGFITPEGDSKDLFFHESGVTGTAFSDLNEGDKVTYETEDSEKGPRAVNVTVV